MIIAISKKEFNELKKLHDLHAELSPKYMTAAVAFLCIGALIVIGCSSLCLTLPGVNAMTQVIMPAIIPSIFAIVVAIPLIIYIIKQDREAACMRKILIDKMFRLLQIYHVSERSRPARVGFILKNFLSWQEHPKGDKGWLRNAQWSRDYQNDIVAEMKKAMGDNEDKLTDRQKKIDRAFKKCIVRIPKNKT